MLILSVLSSHAPDPETPIEQALEGFAAAIESKQVRHIGCCNVDGDQLRNTLEASDRLGLAAFEWVQDSFSLLKPNGISVSLRYRHWPVVFLPENIGQANPSRQGRGLRCTQRNRSAADRTDFQS